jgi:type IV pilus assembly protein PilC
MPTFRYSAIDQNGRPYGGSLEAESMEAVRNRLTELRYYVVSLEPVVASSKASDFLKSFSRAKPKELVVFSRQFATMIDAGLSVLKCLDILQRQTKDPVLREALGTVRHDVNSGASLTDAMGKHPRVFSKLYVNMVRSAEAGGILDQVLDRLATFLEKEQDLKQKVRSAMMYPTIVFIFACIVMTVMMVFVLPRFKQIFDDMGIQKLPLPTAIMMGMSMAISHYWYLVLTAIAAVIVAVWLYGRTETGAMHIDSLRLRVPIFGEITIKVAISRFSRTFGTLIASGVPVLRALEITTDTAGNLAIAQIIDRARVSVKDGERISDPLQNSPLFPVMVSQMIAVGEETGRLDQMLVKIADFYDAEVDATLKGMASLIEPFMIVGLGVMVGFIAISVISPIYGLMGNVK